MRSSLFLKKLSLILSWKVVATFAKEGRKLSCSTWIVEPRKEAIINHFVRSGSSCLQHRTNACHYSTFFVRMGRTRRYRCLMAELRSNGLSRCCKKGCKDVSSTKYPSVTRRWQTQTHSKSILCYHLIVNILNCMPIKVRQLLPKKPSEFIALEILFAIPRHLPILPFPAVLTAFKEVIKTCWKVFQLSFSQSCSLGEFFIPSHLPSEVSGELSLTFLSFPFLHSDWSTQKWLPF